MKFFFFKKKKSAEEKFKEAIDRYHKALEQNPDDVRLYIKIAEVYLEHNQKEKAIENYVAAARAYQEKRLLQIAVAIYNHIITLDPDRVDVYTELASVHLKNGFIGDAVAVLEKLAHYYHAKKKEFEAVQVLKKIKEIDPNNEFFKIKVEKFYTSKDLSEEATLKAGPADKWTLVEQGRGVDEQHVQAQGNFDLATALSADDDMSFSITTTSPDEPTLGDDQTGAGTPDEVFEAIKKLVASSPDQDSPMFHYNLGLAYERCNDYAQAVEEFRAALPGCSDKLACTLHVARCLAALKRFDEAQKHIREALQLSSLQDSDKLELLYCSGTIYKQQGDRGSALQAFKKVYAADKNFKSVAQEIKKLS